MESNKSSSRCHTAIIPILLPIIADNINFYPRVNVKDYEQYAPVIRVQTDDIDFSKTHSANDFYHRLEWHISNLQKAILIFYSADQEIDLINAYINYSMLVHFMETRKAITINVIPDSQESNLGRLKPKSYFIHQVKHSELSKLLKELV